MARMEKYQELHELGGSIRNLYLRGFSFSLPFGLEPLLVKLLHLVSLHRRIIMNPKKLVPFFMLIFSTILLTACGVDPLVTRVKHVT